MTHDVIVCHIDMCYNGSVKGWQTVQSGGFSGLFCAVFRLSNFGKLDTVFHVFLKRIQRKSTAQQVVKFLFMTAFCKLFQISASRFIFGKIGFRVPTRNRRNKRNISCNTNGFGCNNRCNMGVIKRNASDIRTTCDLMTVSTFGIPTEQRSRGLLLGFFAIRNILSQTGLIYTGQRILQDLREVDVVLLRKCVKPCRYSQVFTNCF